VGSIPGRGRGPHAFVADLEAPELEPDDRHHLGRALRLRAGDALTVADGRGSWRDVRFGDPLDVAGPVRHEEAPSPPVTVGLAPVKGQRPEWAVQKLTEIGVDAIWLLVADRSVVRWEGDRAAGHHQRLVRVVREAAMQSRRTRLPELRVGVPVGEAAGGARAALAHPGGGPPGLDRPVVLVGPEGGWSEDELALAPRVGLGPTVLRAETAALVAGALLVAGRSGVATLRAAAPSLDTDGG
jgi:16S rRNA (uracil1498-N3)-methyltransferase